MNFAQYGKKNCAALINFASLDSILYNFLMGSLGEAGKKSNKATSSFALKERKGIRREGFWDTSGPHI